MKKVRFLILVTTVPADPQQLNITCRAVGCNLEKQQLANNRLELLPLLYEHY